MGFINRLFSKIEKVIEKIGYPNNEEEQLSALKRACERASELIVEKATLEDHVADLERELAELQEYYSSHLFSDEVIALKNVVDVLANDKTLDDAKCINTIEILNNLLGRSIHSTLTNKELNERINKVING
jgi:molybdopterin converting factor small subunit